ncbi:LysR family transcriptional regulator [Thalassococcus sp. CAU 1522]|uniref:LysR family transcriptional regulator n=1 Tax=Thalassococcus arenae TaxID=2851652 RepID=A0ABS6NBF3_9RHOB|nr:hydrogen peroxide-inducible genes activator [Thalassococcus arenae]MBV2361308.1 LysR family transcriptional regulator [Thalassococcus arenae]
MATTPSLRQLRYFVTLAEAGQVSRAAEWLGLSQPSLSLQISALETRLGLALVERRRRGVVLTPEGRLVLERAKRVLDEVSALGDLAQSLGAGLTGQLRLGASPTVGPYLLPGLVRRMHRDHPDFRLVLRDGAPRDLVEELLAGRHDVILTQLPVTARGIAVARLFREPLRVAMAHDHPLAAKDMLTDADLAGQDVLTLPDAFALHSQIAELCRDVGAGLRADYEGTSLDALRLMASMGMGLAFLPALYLASEAGHSAGDVVVRPFRQDRVTRSIGLVWRQSAAPSVALERLTNLLRRTLREDHAGRVIAEA